MPAARRCSARAPYGVYELPLAHRMTAPRALAFGVPTARRARVTTNAAKRCSDAGRKPRNRAASRPGFPVTGRLCVRRLAPHEPILSAATAAKWQTEGARLRARDRAATTGDTCHGPCNDTPTDSGRRSILSTSRPQRSLFQTLRTLTPALLKGGDGLPIYVNEGPLWACWSLHPALSLHRE